MITIDFVADKKHARQIQLLTMAHNGWFMRNPMPMFRDDMQFKISFADGNDYKQFSTRLSITTQPYF